MEIWWEFDKWSLEIQEYPVERSTEQFLFADKSRHSKDGEFYRYFSTRQEALEHSIEKLSNSVKSLRSRASLREKLLARYTEELAKERTK